MNEPWKTEHDAKLAAMEAALKVACDERDAARAEAERLKAAVRQLRDAIEQSYNDHFDAPDGSCRCRICRDSFRQCLEDTA